MSKSNKIYVNVMLPVPLPGTFTYLLPSRFEGMVESGSMVKCIFGSKTYWGIVKNISEESPDNIKIKEISDVIYPFAFIPQNILNYWNWISEYYLCPIGEVMQAAVPSKIIPSFSPKYTAIYGHEISELSPNENVIYELLQGRELTSKTIAKESGIKSASSILKRLEQKKAIQTIDISKEIRTPNFEVRVQLHPNYQQAEAFEILLKENQRSTARKRALIAIRENSTEDSITKKQLMDLFRISPMVYNYLKEQNWIEEQRVSKDHTINTRKEKLAFLSDKQEKVYFQIQKLFTKKDVVLLHGITSSGKTEIYFHLIATYLSKGKQVLFMLPEITLTQHIITRFIAVFGDRLKVYHSKISDIERAKIWHGIKDESIQMVVGVRSAALLPFQNLGLVIVDEEHEQTYKQNDPAPRYNGRDAAIISGTFQNAKIVLGSATPSVQSYYNAQKGKYGLVELSNRHQSFKLPDIHLVDLLDCYKKNKLVKHFSYELLTAIKDVLGRGERVLLFQNRRGYAPSIECNECGYVHLCPNCNVTLTLHKSSRSLVCHYCDFSEAIFYYCPECHSPKIMDKGMGTEKIEDEIRALIPGAKVARVDTDSASSRKNVSSIFSKFESGQLDILVGTQMISKGIDFAKVGLVGVLNADNLLNFPSFMAGERSFQLLTQVAGRAGRNSTDARVVIQTHHIDHPVLKAVTQYNYSQFIQNELEERETFHYPPFVKLIHLNIRHRSENVAEQFSQLLAKKLKALQGAIILGPEAPGVDKIKNYYYRKITLKCGKNLNRQKLGVWLFNVIEALKSHESYKYISVNFDADPLG